MKNRSINSGHVYCAVFEKSIKEEFDVFVLEHGDVLLENKGFYEFASYF